MAHTNHRTWQTHRVGHLLVSVHLDPVADGRPPRDERELANVTRTLIETADAHSLPVTWAVSDPAHSAATRWILRCSTEQELAILGDPSWLGPAAGRTRFARELTRRVSQARDAGIPVTSLVPRVASIERHVDLVVKSRITAVAGVPETADDSGRALSPRAIHYGVWELPISSQLPAKRRWFMPAEWHAWRHIRRAATDAATFHLAVDAPHLIELGPQTVTAVSTLLNRVAELRDRGMIRVETLGAAAARLADVPAIAPQRSILRRAA